MVSQLENKISVAKKSSKKRVLKKSVTKNGSDIAKEKIIVVKKTLGAGKNIINDHFNSVAKSVGISCIIMTAIVVAITPSHTWILGPVIGAMCIFGIAMGYFASK